MKGFWLCSHTAFRSVVFPMTSVKFLKDYGVYRWEVSHSRWLKCPLPISDAAETGPHPSDLPFGTDVSRAVLPL